MGMLNQPNVGGTRGWKAMRGTCPVCGRDVALSPLNRRRDQPGYGHFAIKKHGRKGRVSERCKGEGHIIRHELARFPKDPRDPP
jgi:hypothetical protein